MSKIVSVDDWRIDLPPPVPRSDAIQSFVVQETPMVRITCADGREGVGYSYTIGTGGSSVVALLRDHLAPRLIGRDAACIESIWRDLLFATHAAVAFAAVQEKDQFRASLATRDLIGMAKGILMERHRTTGDRAFAVLVRASQDTNRKLRDVADELVHSGRLPEAPPARR